MPSHEEVVHQPDILIIEGLNVLQVGSGNTEFVSDYFDFSIYIDALETDIESWFIERFQTLRKTVFQDPNSFFRHFADLTQDQAVELAHEIWAGINGKNLKENIQPTRARASLVIQKGADHKVNAVHLRKL
jgi:type I pantothenate kinase